MFEKLDPSHRTQAERAGPEGPNFAQSPWSPRGRWLAGTLGRDLAWHMLENQKHSEVLSWD